MDFTYLEKFGVETKRRFDTLSRNVRARSNSFYDSYLDLLEEITKNALLLSSYPGEIDKNAGYLLHKEEYKKHLREAYLLEEPLLEKLHDLTLKANRHKHAKEKCVDVRSVLAFMEPFYLYSRALSGLSSEAPYAFDPSYFISLFDELEKENKRLRKEVDSLYLDAIRLNKENKLTLEELNSCKGLVDSISLQNEDLERQNEEIKKSLGLLKAILLNRMDKLEEKVDDLKGKYVRLDEKVTRLLNGRAASKPSPKKGAPNLGPSLEDEKVLKEFFSSAKVYFSDDADGRTRLAEGKFLRRGIVLAVTSLVTLIIACCMPGFTKLFALISLFMGGYAATMIAVGAHNLSYESEDPEDFFNIAGGLAFYDGHGGVRVSSLSGKWLPLAIGLFVLSIIGALSMLSVASYLYLESNQDLSLAFGVLQGVAASVILFVCLSITSRHYEYRYVIFQKGDDVVRFDTKTGTWATRDKRFKDYRL